MAAIAERLIGTLLATAEPDFGSALDLELYRAYTGTFMGAVAERLIERFPAGAPPIGARFEFNSIRLTLRYTRFRHILVPFDWRAVDWTARVDCMTLAADTTPAGSAGKV